MAATDALLRRGRRLAYVAFGALPPRVRRGVVSLVAPSYTVGALAVIHDGDLVLFVTQLHRPGLALPGGLLKRGEQARSALLREVSEELALDGSGFGATPDTAHVDAARTRVDLLFFLPVDRTTVHPTPGAETLSYRWRPLDDPELTPQTKEILAAVAGRLPG